MLKTITLNNYKTFIKERTLDFTASKYTFLEKENVGNDGVLKGALLVGENASGKTNILMAIRFLIQAFFGVNAIDFFGMKSFYTEKNEFSLEYVFVEDKIEIVYRVACTVTGFAREELTVAGEKIFIRKKDKVEIYRRDVEPERRGGISDTLLFLRSLYFDTGFSDNPILIKWAQYLQKSIYINCHNHLLEGNPTIINALVTNQYLESHGTDEINNFFNKIKYRQKIYFSNIAKNKSGTFQRNAKFLSFEKAGTDAKIPMEYESTGNKSLIYILLAFIHAVKNDSILVVDEFSSDLHNELEECLIRYFFIKSRNSQIFFTTHSTNILDSKIMRPDQVYSVKFDGMNGTVLKRFSERNPMPRVAQNLEHMYLNGEFDGKPYYDSRFED